MANSNNCACTDKENVCSLKVSERSWQVKAAINFMKKMGICEDFIDVFAERQWPCWYENFHFVAAGYWTYQDKELQTKIDEFENKTGALVYAVTKNFTEFGEIYSFLFISAGDELDIPYEYEDNHFEVFAYVWNKTDDSCSEYGDICVKSLGGGIARVA